MLSRCENRIMDAIYGLCDGTDGCLVSAGEILSVLPRNTKLNAPAIEKMLYNLHGDGYFDIITSSRGGERMYVIMLKESGLNFRRAKQQRTRDVIYKIALAFVGAFATFIFGVILNAISCG